MPHPNKPKDITTGFVDDFEKESSSAISGGHTRGQLIARNFVKYREFVSGTVVFIGKLDADNVQYASEHQPEGNG